MRRVAAGTLLGLVLMAGTAHADFSDFGIESLSASQSSAQAGKSTDLTISFAMKTDAGNRPQATTRDMTIDLPPGLLGNPNAVAKCTAAQLTKTSVADPDFSTNEGSCPQDSQVGITRVTVLNDGGLNGFTEPLYNMESPGGDTVARLGFIAQAFPVFINIEVRSESDYGVSAKLESVPSLIALLAAKTTIWGVPADESHDIQRITPYEAINCSGAPCTPTGKRSSGLAPAPFLVNPTRCGVSRGVTVTAASYAEPDRTVVASTPLPQISGCAKLGFEPSFEATPTTTKAGAPTGLDVDLKVPQDETVAGLATSHLRDAVVILPEGMRVAPGAADGLAACSASEVRYKTREASHCPGAAKIGTAELDVPALSRPLRASIYQRTPEPGRLFGIWLVVDDLGVHAKLPGKVNLDPETGQVTSVFVDNPEVPLRELKLHIFGGPRAPLANPANCGIHLTHFELSPWSAGPSATGEAPMTIDSDCDRPGFSPTLSAGAVSPAAGAFSPFTLRLDQEDGEPNVSRLDVTAPPGLLAKLKGVPLCEVPWACPSGSRIGTTTVAVGPGPEPLWIPQPGKAPTAVYLAGPYQGAPYSLVVTTPAQAGPFDLGTVVTRAAIDVDPGTAQVTVMSDPLPQFLEGVPITYRTIAVDVSRPGFTLNPTSCRELAVSAKVVSNAGATAEPSSRFQVGGCRELGFKPRLRLRLLGPPHRGANPRLRAVLTPRPGDANLAKAVVALPSSAFLDQGHIDTVCTRVQFNSDACPRGSIYGSATARSPLLGQPLKGPVYLRSSSHLLPDLVIALRGPIDVDVVGRIDSVDGGLRSTFDLVPDAPVSKFVLSMLGGKKGLLVNSRNLCRAPSRATVGFTGQNGRRRTLTPLVENDCDRERRKTNKTRRSR